MKPDLVITHVTYTPSNPEPEELVEAHLSYKNVGTTATKQFYLYLRPLGPPANHSGRYIGGDGEYVELDPGKAITRTNRS